MALVWLFSPQYPLAMLPFGVYSIFHVATYTRTNLIPTLQPPQPISPPAGASPSAKPTYKNNALADSISKFVKEYYDLSMGLVAILEIALWIRIFLSAIIFARGSWILLVLYTAFLRSRFAQSSFVQGQFSNLAARIDALAGGQGTPPAARQVWEGIKGGARQFHDVTDVKRYASAPQGPPKKAS
jgi:transmembrane protein 33